MEVAILGDLQAVAKLTRPSSVAPGSPASGAFFFSFQQKRLSKHNFLTPRTPIQLSTVKESKDVQSPYIIANNFDDYLIHGGSTTREGPIASSRQWPESELPIRAEHEFLAPSSPKGTWIPLSHLHYSNKVDPSKT
jgi:hypothetical protein